MKKFLKNIRKALLGSTFLGILMFPMNVLTRIPYVEIWEKGDLPSKIIFGVVVVDLWAVMLILLDTYTSTEGETK